METCKKLTWNLCQGLMSALFLVIFNRYKTKSVHSLKKF